MGSRALGREIAKASLGIGSIKLRPAQPFQWASGYFMPIYNDNRMLLGDYAHRKLVTDGFVETIRANNISFDLVAGTSTAGIAPAASVAQRFDVPLVIMHEGEAYAMRPSMHCERMFFDGNPEAVATTCPWAIAAGVKNANNHRLPFLYVRQAKKSHGMQQQIEGRVVPGQKVVLLDQHIGDSYYEDAIRAIGEAGMDLVGRATESVHGWLPHMRRSLGGKNVLVIEDLISTGGSSAKEVIAYQEKGAHVAHCISIFNYELDVARREFDGHGCAVHSLLTYDVLLGEARTAEYIRSDEVGVLQEWRADPFAWGEKHGFPPVKKK